MTISMIVFSVRQPPRVKKSPQLTTKLIWIFLSLFYGSGKEDCGHEINSEYRGEKKDRMSYIAYLLCKHKLKQIYDELEAHRPLPSHGRGLGSDVFCRCGRFTFISSFIINKSTYFLISFLFLTNVFHQCPDWIYIN